MKILVLGSGGMLGHKLLTRLHDAGFQVEGTIRGHLSESPLASVIGSKPISIHENVDVMDLGALKQLLCQIGPDLLINCVGIIKQRHEAKSGVPSITVNALLPHLLAEWAETWHGHVIHFSTDCVFSGERGDYRLDDPSDAKDLYGKSKFLGEIARDNALTIRTSIIGRELSHFASLVEWFLGQDRKAVKGFTRAYYSGMTTETMADLIRSIVSQSNLPSGLCQAVSDKISKYDLLLLMREAYGLNVRIEPDQSFYCDRSMLSSGFTESIGFVVPSWRDQICRMADATP